MGPKFEGLSKEAKFKGVVIKCRKLSIQAQYLRNSCNAHANVKNQSFVADSIEFMEPIITRQFVNAKENTVNYTVKADNGTDKVDGEMKKTKLERVSYQVKF